jgi:hypothetical protein
MYMNPLRNIAKIAIIAVVLSTGTAFANTNTPTVQTVHHWPSTGQVSKVTPPSHAATIGIYSHGRGVGAKQSSPRWR